jgi:predicted lysophospholipase L1 biosynthesis ABC-type transport system permease subunit
MGVSLALDRRAPVLPVRSAIAGVAVATVGVVAVLTFSASLDRLLTTPARWGYGWDLLLNFTSDNVDAAAADVAADDRLSAVARWDAGFSYVGGQGVRAYGLSPLAGEIGFALRSGRQPVTAGEIVLGPDTADRLGVQIGDRVTVARQSNQTDGAEAVVVGIALFPDDGDGSFSDAVGYFGEAFAQHAIAPDLFEASQLVVRVPPGHDVEELARSLDEQYPGSASSGENLPVRPGEVATLADIHSLPGWLAAFVATLGVASLCNVLLTTVRRRRVQLATLRSLGLTSQQIVSCMVCQAATITALGLLIGLPLGILAGRTSWFVVANPIGVATDSSRSIVAVFAVALAALLCAALVALGPGWRATRLRPAQALRVE